MVRPGLLNWLGQTESSSSAWATVPSLEQVQTRTFFASRQPRLKRNGPKRKRAASIFLWQIKPNSRAAFHSVSKASWEHRMDREMALEHLVQVERIIAKG